MRYIILPFLSYSTAIFAAPLAQTNTAATNSPQQGVTGAGVQAGQTGSTATTSSAQQIANAVNKWQIDTSVVSNFLNTGASITDDTAFKQAALVAYNANVDELTQKAVLESAPALASDKTVQAANSTLTGGGTMQDVINKLQEMSTKGLAAVQNIDSINQVRCVYVMPNIDAYFVAAGSGDQGAIRPTICDATGVAGGIHGTGPTKPGQQAGTPQQAFDAAARLVASGQIVAVSQGGQVSPNAANNPNVPGSQAQANLQAAGALLGASPNAKPNGAAPATAQTPSAGAQGTVGGQTAAGQAGPNVGAGQAQAGNRGGKSGGAATTSNTGATGQRAGANTGNTGGKGANGQLAGASTANTGATGA